MIKALEEFLLKNYLHFLKKLIKKKKLKLLKIKVWDQTVMKMLSILRFFALFYKILMDSITFLKIYPKLNKILLQCRNFWNEMKTK